MGSDPDDFPKLATMTIRHMTVLVELFALSCMRHITIHEHHIWTLRALDSLLHAATLRLGDLQEAEDVVEDSASLAGSETLSDLDEEDLASRLQACMGTKTKKFRWRKGWCAHFSPVDGPKSPEIYSYSSDSSGTRWESLLEEHEPADDYPEPETEPSDKPSVAKEEYLAKAQH